jgi:23S rRNA (cytosine1962-C5)-methyltransferase
MGKKRPKQKRARPAGKPPILEVTGSYSLLDSGAGRKLEQFGAVTLARPAAQAAWKRDRQKAWSKADAAFDRDGGNRWTDRNELPESWFIEVDGIHFKLSATDFGHLGIFPEQRPLWRWIGETVRQHSKRKLNILNLFAYSGGSTLAAARAGAAVCHLDASKGMVEWARENAALNELSDAPIRWITDDAIGFLQREARRDRRYDGIILDPPTFGRGKRGEVFKIEDDLHRLLDACEVVLSDDPVLFLLSGHTPGYSAQVLANILEQRAAKWPTGNVDSGEMLLEGENARPLPSGAYARWRADSPEAQI